MTCYLVIWRVITTQSQGMHYVSNWSLWLDLKILLMTVKATRNAY